MRKFTLTLSIIFVILTFAGAIYVLVNHGQVNAGYACVPLVWALASLIAHWRVRKKKSPRCQGDENEQK